MDKRFLAILVAIILIFGGIFWFSKSKSSQSNNGSGDSSQSEGSTNFEGNPDAKVQLVEFGDYQCPACYAYYPVVKQAVDKYQDKILFQFRNFPLVQIHPNAMAAARAAEAAALQGKFWQMHDMLYQNQNNWSSSQSAASIFESYAQQLGLDMNQYKQDVNSAQVLATINADVKAAQALGATGTPVFVLNGKKIESPGDLAGFSKVIDEALEQAGQNQ